tara:strand:- start:130 stop:591 length:462 start_codon:yes stop_codon:yes gene_type:complete
MEISNLQKLIGIAVYLLPWSDSIPFGRSLFIQIPALQVIAIPAIPLIILERLIPFGSLILFFGLFVGVVRNINVPYFIRFNALQAILMDICLILLNYALQILVAPLGNDLILQTISSTCLIGMLSIMIFTIIECLQGKEPDLPGISNAVRIQL